MKDCDIKSKNKCYELNNDIKYKRKSIDFNEYGFNKNYFEDENLLNYVAKSGPNCVKKIIKR